MECRSLGDTDSNLSTNPSISVQQMLMLVHARPDGLTQDVDGEAMDRSRTLPVPSALQRNLVAFCGLSMAIVMPYVFLLSFDSQGLAWACALVTHGLGLLLLFLWWQVGSRVSDALEPRESKSAILKTIGSTSQQNPIAEPLTELRGQTNSHDLE